jgi:carbon storage regulator
MLSLTRKPGQSVILNNGRIRVQVVEVQGNRVRLGFVAPPEMPVDREEVHERKELKSARR